MAEDLKTLADQLVNLSVKDVQSLLDVLKEEHGIEPAAAVAVAPAAPAAGAEVAEEKTSFNVMLKSAGAAKLSIVKLVKSSQAWALKKLKSLSTLRLKLLKKA